MVSEAYPCRCAVCCLSQERSRSARRRIQDLHTAGPTAKRTAGVVHPLRMHEIAEPTATWQVQQQPSQAVGTRCHTHATMDLGSWR